MQENDHEDLKTRKDDRRASTGAENVRGIGLVPAFAGPPGSVRMLSGALSAGSATHAPGVRLCSADSFDTGLFLPEGGPDHRTAVPRPLRMLQLGGQQTGFDPGQSAIPTDQRVRVVPMPPPGHDTATLAIAGAVLGALIGGPRHAVGGALIGASGGAIAGAASDSARLESARQQEEAYAARDRTRDARLEEKASIFRRAMSACLEGRGYSVR
jgi:hypothetical protein